MLVVLASNKRKRVSATSYRRPIPKHDYSLEPDCTREIASVDLKMPETHFDIYDFYLTRMKWEGKKTKQKKRGRKNIEQPFNLFNK